MVWPDGRIAGCIAGIAAVLQIVRSRPRVAVPLSYQHSHKHALPIPGEAQADVAEHHPIRPRGSQVTERRDKEWIHIEPSSRQESAVSDPAPVLAPRLVFAELHGSDCVHRFCRTW